jgi:hypothetical protein
MPIPRKLSGQLKSNTGGTASYQHVFVLFHTFRFKVDVFCGIKTTLTQLYLWI